MLGIISTEEAMRKARDAGMDLVEVSPNERPPVCRIMDYGKHKYNQAKKQKQRHHEQKIKEVRLRPKTDPHDKGIKLKRAQGFLEQGDRVQFTMLFRGRERFHHEVGMAIFNDIIKELEPVAKVDRYPRALGRRMTMVLVPAKTPSPSKPKPKPKAQAKGSEPAAKPEDAAARPAAQATETATPAPSAPPPDAPEPGPGDTPTA